MIQREKKTSNYAERIPKSYYYSSEIQMVLILDYIFDGISLNQVVHLNVILCCMDKMMPSQVEIGLFMIFKIKVQRTKYY